MKVICPVCQKTSQDGNLWCDNLNCPAGNMPPLMDYGDYFGNNQIVQVRRVMSAATLYDAECEGQPVLLKVAHREKGECLEREIEVLRELSKKHKLFPATALPRLLEDGASVFRGEVFRYAKFEAISGDVLSDKLLQHPEPWYKHVGWFVQQLAATLELFHRAGYAHGALCADVVLVHQDKMGVWLPVLLDMGTGEPATEQDKLKDFEQMGSLLYHMLTRPPITASLSMRRKDALSDRDDPCEQKRLCGASDSRPKSLSIKRADLPSTIFHELLQEWSSGGPDWDNDPYGQWRLRSELGPRPEFVPRWQFWKRREGRQWERREMALIAMAALLVLLILVLLFL